MAAVQTATVDVSHAQVQQAIDTLYDSTSPANKKTAAQLWLQQLQKETFGWAIASQLLQCEAATYRFFGALTFQLKIANDWHTLAAEHKVQLRDELLQCLLQSSGYPLFVITKICVSLTLIAMRDEHDLWPNFIQSFCQTLDTHAQTVVTDDERVALHLIILEFLIIVPEEAGKAALTPARRAKVTQELNNATSSCLERIQSLLNIQTPPTLTNAKAFQQLKAKALQCMQSWVQYGVPLNSLGPLIHKAIELLPDPQLFDHAMEALIELIGYPSVKAYAATLSNDLLQFISNGWLSRELTRAIQDGDEECARTICRFLIEFGESFCPLSAKCLLRQDFVDYVGMMLALTGFDGYFGADQEISVLPFTFWAFFQEELQESGIFDSLWAEEPQLHTDPATGRPVFKEGGVTAGDAARIAVINIAPATQHNKGEDAAIAQIGRNIFSKLVEILRQKTTFPPESEWNSWPADIRDKFTVFRRDSSDALLTCAYVLREDTWAYLVPLAIHQLGEFERGSGPWQSLEATLFAIKAISDVAQTEEDVYLPKLFGAEFLARMTTFITRDLPPRLHFTTSLLIGSYAEWFRLHPEHLSLAVRYLIASIQLPKLAPKAVDGLLTVCDICRDELVMEADSLVALWTQVGPSLQSQQKSRLVKAVSNVIQKMPYDLLLPRLWALLNGIVTDLSIALDNHKQYPEESKQLIEDQLLCLKSCCRGIQPSESVVTVNDPSSPTTPAIPDSQQQLVAEVIWSATSRMCTIFASDTQIMEPLCAFISETVRSTLPIFTPNLSALIALMIETYATYPMSYLLETAAAIVTANGDSTIRKASTEQREQLSRLLHGLSLVTLRFFEQQDLELYSDIVHAYCDLLNRAAATCPWALTRLPQDVVNAIFGNLLLKTFRLQERMTMNSVLDFLISFIGLHQEDVEFAVLTQYVADNFGQTLVYHLIQGVGGQQPRSMDEKLADTLYKLNARYPELTRGYLILCLTQPGFPSQRVSMAEKEEFVKSIVGTRHLKRFREGIKKFGLLCRGLANTAF
ncbi:armadillo-type protein [Powellomyces hirtus]|nr:armadillo-type protein [Powellomyces hirtus]